MTSNLISEEYIILNKELHESPRGFGGSGWKHAEHVIKFAKELRAFNILDYGCGQATLGSEINRISDDSFKCNIDNYDPAIPEFSKDPKNADLVVCTDVLEHVEPNCIDAVLDNIYYLAFKGIFLQIATRPANKILSDGRNAHLTIEPPSWWVEKIEAKSWFKNVKTFRFEIIRNENKIPKERSVLIWIEKF